MHSIAWEDAGAWGDTGPLRGDKISREEFKAIVYGVGQVEGKNQVQKIRAVIWPNRKIPKVPQVIATGDRR
ncbi:MAG: hypothetical protein EA342_07350 [Leptolyngbya sp. LCM1.Bin17]|nr:MAG: hypothetical protein EA342_07350 [Leptolyngbya sp. LCM1.Bin17]